MSQRFQSAHLGALVLMCAGATQTLASGVDVRVSFAQQVLIGDVDVEAVLSISNNSGVPVRLAKTQLPGQMHEGALFRVRRDGQPVDYTGPLVKRGPLGAADYLSLAPGATLSYRVELTAFYDLSRDGQYTVEFVGLDKRDMPSALQSQSSPSYVWLQGRSPQLTLAPQAQASLAGSISYTGNCSASQKSQLATAVSNASSYAQSSSNYLSASPSATSRYKTWFGAFSSSGWNTAKAHFAAEVDAFKNKPLTLDCSCKQSYYAYVYPTQPYKIYVCNAFWSAPATGTDSKAGTLVHEMSHFNVVAGTDDWAYGQSAAKSLALSNPTRALDNADSHEYFAENSPPLP